MQLQGNDFLVRIIWLFLRISMGAFYPFDLIPLATFTHQLADLKYYLLNSPLADVIVSSDQINMPFSLVKKCILSIFSILITFYPLYSNIYMLKRLSTVFFSEVTLWIASVYLSVHSSDTWSKVIWHPQKIISEVISGISTEPIEFLI